MGILALDIRNGHEEEVIMGEKEYNQLISHKIFQYLNNYDMVTPVANESKYFVSAIKKIANIISGTNDETTPILETFNLSFLYIRISSPLTCSTVCAVLCNKIINQNIRVKELSKLKKLYKELNKK